jgi:nitrogen fixation/metabolism regulation signal transduction histidine kinase
MNHQIDTQIANARLMRLPGTRSDLAADLVREAVADYPYRSTRERDCVKVEVGNDFMFEGSHALFAQVIDNLMKNALRSLAAASTASQPGDLSIEVDTLRGRGGSTSPIAAWGSTRNCSRASSSRSFPPTAAPATDWGWPSASR